MPRIEPTLLAAHIRRIAPPGAEALTDAQLLERFATNHDEAAFEVLTRRHGPMVWRTCQRVLGDHQLTEDAFQATLIVLARKAEALARPHFANGSVARDVRDELGLPAGASVIPGDVELTTAQDNPVMIVHGKGSSPSNCQCGKSEA